MKHCNGEAHEASVHHLSPFPEVCEDTASTTSGPTDSQEEGASCLNLPEKPCHYVQISFARDLVCVAPPARSGWFGCEDFQAAEELRQREEQKRRRALASSRASCAVGLTSGTNVFPAAFSIPASLLERALDEWQAKAAENEALGRRTSFG